MLLNYQKLARLLEREEMVLGQVASFYQELAESLKLGKLPALSELFADGVQFSDDLKKAVGEKKAFFDEIKVNSLRQLLVSQYPAKVRYLVALKGSEIAKLRRKIEASGTSIRQSLSALQVVNKRFLDFFQQLCPANISYQGKGGMADNRAVYCGVSLNGVA